MRIPACVAIASLITTSYALTRGRLGFVLSVKNPDKTCKLQSDYELDLSTIRSNTGATIVRTYSASDCNSTRELLPAAQAKRFQVVLGVWPDSERTFQADKLALVEHATRYPAQVHAVTVGSETLNRGNLTGPELLSKINEVKAIVPGTKVGTADRWNKFADGSADALIRGGVELLMANALPSWEGKNVKEGAISTYFDDVQQALGRIRQISGGSTNGIEFWNGEAGWPTRGMTYRSVVPSTENAAALYQGVCSLLRWGINVF